MLDDRVAERGRQRVERFPVVGERHPQRGRGKLRLGEPLHVVPAGRDEPVDQLVAVLGEPVAEVVTGLAQRPQQHHRGRGGVEPDGVADPGVLARVGRQHDGELLGRVGPVPQPRVPHRDPGRPRGPLRVGDVDRHVVRAGLLERARARVMSRPSNSGMATCIAASIGRQRRARGLPGGAGGGQAQRLHQRDVEVGERADVPGLVVAAGGRVGRRGRAGAAGREHRDEQRVGAAEQVVDLRAGRAQRGAEHRQRVRAVRLHRVGQRVDEGGVPGDLVRPVEDDADRRPAGQRFPGAVHAVGRQRDRRVEPVPGQQQRVGQEPGQLGEVAGPPSRR